MTLAATALATMFAGGAASGAIFTALLVARRRAAAFAVAAAALAIVGALGLAAEDGVRPLASLAAAGTPESDAAVAGLAAYVRTLPDGEAVENTAALPDVATMIARLAARLEREPGDVEGWRMLGWSYVNTRRYAEAAAAYARALDLRPESAEFKTARDEAAAMAAEGAGDGSPTPGGPPQTMIRDMVERLASKLETAPKDADGWIRLMRSRMTLGEPEAARAAEAKALAAFAGETEPAARIEAAAKELGVAQN